MSIYSTVLLLLAFSFGKSDSQVIFSFNFSGLPDALFSVLNGIFASSIDSHLCYLHFSLIRNTHAHRHNMLYWGLFYVKEMKKTQPLNSPREGLIVGNYK